MPLSKRDTGDQMPQEGETRTCEHPGSQGERCGSTQRFSVTAAPPDVQAGIGVKDGSTRWNSEQKRRAAWKCDKNPEHFDPV